MADVADRLRALADAATPGPWEWNEDENLVHGEDYVACNLGYDGMFGGIEAGESDARLIALAPDLARGYADALDALANLTWRSCIHTGYTQQQLDEARQRCDSCRARAVLAESGRLLGDT